MMRHKIVIANSKQAQLGKSTSIRYVFELLSKRYNHRVLRPATGYDPTQDIEAIIEIPQADGHIVKVGIESFGDPGYTTLHDSIDQFLAEECEIILMACRTKGDTIAEVGRLRNLKWQAIWFDNSSITVDSHNNQFDATGTRFDKQD